MSEITRIGADLAKNVIQVHAVDAAGKVVTSRALSRDKFMPWCAQLPQGCLIAMEASSSAHHWARKLVVLGLDARIIAAHLVAPYRLQGKSGKSDANDAAAICEAASRAQMHFVPIKTIDQQSMLCIHRLREGFKEERNACTNRIRGLLAEFGLVFGQKTAVLKAALTDVLEDATKELNGLARLALQGAQGQKVGTCAGECSFSSRRSTGQQCPEPRLTNGAPGARLSSGSARIELATMTVCNFAVHMPLTQ